MTKLDLTFTRNIRRVNIEHSALHLFTIQVENNLRACDFLKSKNIETLIHYPHTILHYLKKFDIKFELLRNYSNGMELENFSDLSIPIGMHLSKVELNEIIDTINTQL
jgi:dTDP-4-amino-4,6-dideoxygalactose transaminase